MNRIEPEKHPGLEDSDPATAGVRQPLLLRHHRRRVHAHSRRRAPALDSGAHGGRGPALRPGPHPGAADPGRHLRAVPPVPLPGHQAVFDRRRGGAPAVPRPDAGDRRRPLHQPGRARHEPPRPAERDGPHRAPRRRRDPRRLRGRRSPEHPGRRRRQVPHGCHRRPRRAQRAHGEHPPGFEPEPPGGRRSRGRRPGAGQAGADGGREGPREGLPDHPPRRRRLRGPGGPRRDAELRRPARLPRGRHGARDRQQPDRFHHRAQGAPLLALRLGRGPAAADPHLPRQRRRPRRGGAGGADGRRLPLRLQERRGGGPDRLPPPRPQRGGRPDHHPAAALQEDRRSIPRSGGSTPRPSASPRKRPSAGRRPSAPSSTPPTRRPGRSRRSPPCAPCRPIGTATRAAAGCRSTRSRRG